MKLIKPNYKKSILNVAATLADFLGKENDKPKLKILQNELKKGYKNVVYMCLDGFGMYPIMCNLNKSDFLRKNIKQEITSTCLATTTAATTTLQTAKYPMEHGYFGWSMYFKKLKKNVDVYLGADSLKHEPVDMSKISDYLNFEPYYQFIDSEYRPNCVVPYLPTGGIVTQFKTFDEFFKTLNKICKRKTKQFVYAYNEDPDHTMHDFGVNSKEAYDVINDLNKRIEKFMENNPDTLLIITPDHGHLDIKEYIEMYKDKALYKTLETRPYLEPRLTAYKLKNGKEKEFLKEIKKYKKDLKLYKTKDFVKQGYLGPETEKIEMLGDYITVMNNDYKMLLINEDSYRFKGNHAGLSKKEMILPLIIVGNK